VHSSPAERPTGRIEDPLMVGGIDVNVGDGHDLFPTLARN